MMYITEYLQGGGSDTATEEPKKAATPGYPNENYPINVDIQWIISGQQGYVVVIHFTEFDIEQGYDFVYVGMYRYIRS